MFAIEDEMHDERCGEFSTRERAMAELRRLALLPWDQEPSQCPCIDWRTCGRRYELVEYDTSALPGREIGR